MRTYKRLIIKNFLSFGNKKHVIDLSRSDIALIRGINQDAPGVDSSNGAGKTTIFNAISYVLFGEGIEPIKADEFVNWTNKKDMLVTLEFEQDGIEYSITRGRKPKVIRIIKNNEDITPRTDKECDKMIQSIVNMDSLLFTNSELFTSSSQTYMSMKPAQQKTFMEQLLGIDQLTERSKKLKELLKGATSTLALLEREKSLKEAENQRLIENIESLKSKRQQFANNTEIDTLRKQLDELQSYDLHGMAKVYVKIEELESEIHEIEERLDLNIREIADIESKIKKLSIELQHLEEGKCPRCKQDWINENEIETLEQEIEELQTKHSKLLDEQKQIMSDAKPKMIELKEIKRPELTIEEIRSISDQIIVLKQRIAELSGNEIDIIDEQIKTLESQIHLFDEIDAKIENGNILIEHIKLLIKLLTNSRSFIRMRIIERYIPFINMKVNEYLEQLGSLHRIEINSDLTNDVFYRKRKISFGNLSTGQKLRINFAICLAFRDYISNAYSKSNLLMLDEVMDGADRSFVEAAFNILRENDSMTTMIISHREVVKDLVDSIITVEMKHGFSSIKI